MEESRNYKRTNTSQHGIEWCVTFIDSLENSVENNNVSMRQKHDRSWQSIMNRTFYVKDGVILWFIDGGSLQLIVWFYRRRFL